MSLDIRQGELPAALAEIPDATFHGVLTDPPYGLGDLPEASLRRLLYAWLEGEDGSQSAGMLGRAWDVVVPPSTWAEVLRVTRPGGLCAAYSHARTYHLQALSMQLAGWWILPFHARIHGGAMALGHDVSKAIDAAAGAEREVVGTKLGLPGYTASPDKPTAAGIRGTLCSSGRSTLAGETDITAPATPLATAFDGYNTALRNALEPVVWAVRPPEGSWAENARRWGCGGFNVGDARIEAEANRTGGNATMRRHNTVTGGERSCPVRTDPDPRGRYPTNVMLEHAAGCGAGWCVDGCPVKDLDQRGLTDVDNYHTLEGWEKRTHGDSNARRTASGIASGASPEVVDSTAWPNPDGCGKSTTDPSLLTGTSTTSTTTPTTTDLRTSSPGRRSSTDGTTQESERITSSSTESSTDAAKNAGSTSRQRLSSSAPPEPSTATVGIAQKAASTSGERRTAPSTTSTCGTTTAAQEPPPGLRKSRVYYQGRASAEERHRGAEGFLWLEDDRHPDGWRRVEREEWEAAGEHERTQGNPHMAVKAADGGAHLATLLRQPTENSEEKLKNGGLGKKTGLKSPRLLVPFAGSGSEVIGALLAGWRDVTAVEMSEQMVDLCRARVGWWADVVERGGRGKALDLLREWGTSNGPDPDRRQLGLFDV